MIEPPGVGQHLPHLVFAADVDLAGGKPLRLV
jgi:hypothetical protein